MNVLFTTSLPTPYQVELFDALAASRKIELTVLYSTLTHPSRSWDLPRLAHDYCVLSDIEYAEAEELLHARDMVVFSGYHPSALRQLIASRAKRGQPWTFWGERPGFLLPHWLGRPYRQMVLPQLACPNVPIWGIGSWAVDAYCREYGTHRMALNVPYFSKLDEFLKIDRTDADNAPYRILFSGSLTKRKGIDLLIKAFLAIAPEFPTLQLHVVGEGPLRERLRSMSAPVAERVYFHGFKQWAELANIYSNADILCAPSRYDGWGLIIPEALAAGLLVVSSDRTGAAIDLIHEDCGWVVQAGALAPLIDALRTAASTAGPSRVARIALGRSIAMHQNITAGVERILAAIRKSYLFSNGESNQLSEMFQ